MADLASSLVKVNDSEVAANAPHSEALMVKIGSDINGLIDFTTDTFSNSQTFTSSGSFNFPSGFNFVFVR